MRVLKLMLPAALTMTSGFALLKLTQVCFRGKPAEGSPAPDVLIIKPTALWFLGANIHPTTEIVRVSPVVHVRGRHACITLHTRGS